MSKNLLASLCVSLLAAAALFVSVRTVYAHCGICLTDAKYFVGALDKSDFSLADAAEAAEDATDGDAVHATVVRTATGVNVEVHCLVGDHIEAVLVDGQNGKVVKRSQVANLEGHAH